MRYLSRANGEALVDMLRLRRGKESGFTFLNPGGEGYDWFQERVKCLEQNQDQDPDRDAMAEGGSVGPMMLPNGLKVFAHSVRETRFIYEEVILKLECLTP